MKFFPIKIKKELIFDLIIFSIYSFTLFVFLVKFKGSDIKGHNYLLSSYLDEGYFPIPPLYYGLVYLVDLFIRVKYEYVVSSIIVVSFFQWWKYRLVYASLARKNLGLRPITLFLLTLSFLFLSPIYIPAIDGDFWYLGKFTQTIWHSSTLIGSFPFCILLVWKSIDWVNRGRSIDLWKILFLSFLIILIKPSFLFCYIPALPIFIYLKDFRITRQLGTAIGVCCLLFGILMVEKYLIFNWDPVLDVLYSENEKSSVVLNPFKVWLNFTNDPIFDFITSFPLLIAAIIIWRSKIFKNQLVSFSLLLLFFALMVFFLLAESGFREFHANFYWQIPIALFLCNLSVVYFVLEEYYFEKEIVSSKFLVMIFIYLLQVVLGIGFWLRILIDLTHQ